MTQTADTVHATNAEVSVVEPTPEPELDDTPVASDPSAPARARVDIHPSYLLVALAVAFNLWYLRAQRLVIVYPNDSAFHSQMVTAATRMLSHGQNPLASWFPNLSLGSPLFVQYQSFSAIITGAAGLVVGPRQAYAWSLYLLLALWPLCVFWTGRLLRWGRWECGVAAAVAPFLASPHGRGFELAAYVWTGSGLWSELWAMWSIALAVGFGWRYISERRYLFGAVAAFAATIAFHYLMAYLAVFILVLLVFLRPSDLRRRAGRAAIVGGCAFLATLWVTIPLLKEAHWTSTDQFQVGTTITNSYGARAILGWLVRGQLFDSGHLPVVTLLVVLGLGVCIFRFRRDERARVLVAIFTLSLLLYFGRPTLGFVLDRLPGSHDLLFQRFIAGVDLAALFLAGVGVVFAFRMAVAGARRFTPGVLASAEERRWHVVLMIASIVIIGAALFPAWNHAAWYAKNNGSWIGVQQRLDATSGAQVRALLAVADRRGGGRVYDGLPQNYGGATYIGGVQLYNFVEDTNTDAVGVTGRTLSLMSNPEAWFDENNLGDFETFGVHYVLAPAGIRPLVPVTLLARTKEYKLWEIGPSGYFRVVDTRGVISADGTTIGDRTKGFLEGPQPDRAIYPTIAFDGNPAARATLAVGARPKVPAGRVTAERVDLAHGRAVAVVHTTRRAVVLLAASFDPGWTVTVDGTPAHTEMVAPALLGVAIGPGVHRVAFVYHGFGSYPLLFAVALVTMMGVAVVPALWRRRRSASAPEHDANA